MSNKLLDILSKLVPEDQMKDVSEAVDDLMKDVKAELDSEYNTKLEDAYAELASEKKKDEAIAEQGYQEAHTIITDLRNRLETQKIEADKALEEGYEEAYQMLRSERTKNETLELELHEEYEKRIREMREFFIDKIDEFVRTKGKQIYEQARRDIQNDPRMVEHKVALDKVVDVVSNYISDEDYTLATSSKLQEAAKELEELKGRVRLFEAKNIRLSTENNKLMESVRNQGSLLKENRQVVVNEERKARTEKAKNAAGKGRTTSEKTEVIAEYAADKKEVSEEADDRLAESLSNNFGGDDFLNKMQILAGVKKSE